MGSEEHQLGEEYHDEDLYDERIEKFNTLPEFLKNIRSSNLYKYVIPVINSSKVTSKTFSESIGLLFIDGSHSHEAAMCDYNSWKDKISSGGLLVIHDVFPNPEDGGRPPFEIYSTAQKSKDFVDLGIYETLGVLKRI